MTTVGPTEFFKSVENYVDFCGGDHAIRKILIANNGIGAIKAIRSIRRWAYETFGNERAITFVCMATPEDLKANAEYIRMADEVVDVPGGSNNNNYANVSLICEIAERLSVDAVMPMWGHASENPSLPTSILKLNHRVTFIGPPAEPMMALGDKIGSTIIAQSAGVPTIAWNGDGLKVNYKETGIPQEIYNAANVTTAEDALACAERIGFPVMIKASEGGGGKGIRKVTCSADVFACYRQVQGEIPGSPIFVMKMASKARHLEVQLLADKYGDAIALSGRDCSVQRRHQKIIEEGPPTAASPQVFKKMERAAVLLAKTVGYCNAGTVEYLYLEETQEFAFLELNPRLQVEHPVTENILGLNLPCCQLQVAMGIPLHRIGDIRKLYGRHPRGRDTIDFDYAERCAPPRHCIAVRVTAENPEAGFQPTSGKLSELHFHSAIDVWGYFSVDNSGMIHEFADSQFGHIFAGGSDRESARRAMIVALKEIEIRGDIRTTVEYIIKLLQSPDFINNQFDTAWLDGRIANSKELAIEEAILYSPPPTLIATCGAALQSFKHFTLRGKQLIDMLKVGQVPSKDTLSPLVSVDLIFNNVKYCTTCVQSGANSVIIECQGIKQTVQARQLADEGYLLTIGGRNHLIYSAQEKGGSVRLIVDGHTCIFTPEYDPTRLLSTVAGKLARLLVCDGTHLNAGDAYVEIEVMKMYMSLRMVEAGIVRFQMSEGATLSPGDVIANVQLDNPDMVVKAEVFRGRLDDFQSLQDANGNFSFALTPCPSADSEDACANPHIVLRTAKQQIERVLEGYLMSSAEIDEAVTEYVSNFNDKRIPALEMDEAMSVLRGRIDADLASTILSVNSKYLEGLTTMINNSPMKSSSSTSACPSNLASSSATSSTGAEYPAAIILVALHEYYTSLPPENRSAFHNQTATVRFIAEQYLFPSDVRMLSSFLKLLEMYLNVEKLFDNMSFTDVVNELRKDNIGDLDKVLNLCRSHLNHKAKTSLVIRIIEEIKSFNLSKVMQRPRMPIGVPIRNEINIRNLKMRLTDLAKLRQPQYSHVSYAANLILMEQYSITTENRRQKLDDVIIAALTTGDAVGQGDRLAHMKKFVDGNVVIRDLLLESLRHDKDYQIATMEIYLRTIYQKTHRIKNMVSGDCLTDIFHDNCPWIMFEFMTKYVEAVQESSACGGEGKTYNELTELVRASHAQNGQLGSILGCANTPDGTVTPTHSFNASSLQPATPAFPRSLTNEFMQHSVPGSGLDVFGNPLVLGDRVGVFVTIESMDQLASLFPHIIDKVPAERKDVPHLNEMAVNAMHVVVLQGANTGDDETSQQLSTFLASQQAHLKSRNIRRVSFLVGKRMKKSGLQTKVTIFTYRSSTRFVEDRLYRHIEAPHAFHLELSRLSNFNITLVEGVQSSSGNVHLYKALPKAGRIASRRYFARLVSFTNDVHSTDAVELPFVEALDDIAIVIGEEEASAEPKSKSTGANHVFMNIVAPSSVVQPDFVESEIHRICNKYWHKMVRLAVTTFELKLSCRLTSEAEPLNIRFVASNPTGFVLKVDQYYESLVNGRTVFKSIGTSNGPLDGTDSHAAYEVSQKFEQQRAEAMASSDTLYVYDWPVLFENATSKHWDAFYKERPTHKHDKIDDMFTCQELVLCDASSSSPLKKGWSAKDAETAQLLPMQREAGLNDCGMVAWLVRFRTPECPYGREMVLISNDITHQAGSFGTKEDAMFYKASVYARSRGLPRIFLAANSGARIGMAQSLKKMFQVCWADDADPTRGFKYIYITKADYDKLMEKFGNNVAALPVICSPIKGPNDEDRYVVTDIIGEEPDLGVENLMGSGLIAGETARAYDEIFTLTLVVGRTVGIGAYLVRLAQRTIQKTINSPIILTGFQALNKLMGREIYTTNDQLGGPMIMFPNGVSHQLAETHMDSVQKAISWLSFVPSVKGGELPLRDITGVDTVERFVEFAPQKGVPYDPRLLLCGQYESPDDHFSGSAAHWKSGFFDRNSFVETLGGWAKTVVVGRGRLGGIPMGVIVTENRTAEATKPADPADMTSQEKLVQQSGSVWFPDSAYKTAQALRDFNREGLPCIVFANWRGFSGGQRDMFDEVLKFGSMIVDALVAYQQPLFVYIPPFSELRGGAWVVVDSTINSDVMEFYAAEDARGGVLEATGTASIKFRDQDILATCHRIDGVLIGLDARIAQEKEKEKCTAAGGEQAAESDELAASRKTLVELQRQVKQRERMLFGVYQQVAVHFADLHDTPGRMKAKGVIRKQVQWAESRMFFFWRLRRRLMEFELTNAIARQSGQAAQAAGFRKAALSKFQSWFSAQGGGEEVWEEDMSMLAWTKQHAAAVDAYVSAQSCEALTAEVTARLGMLAQLQTSSTQPVLTEAVAKLTAKDKQMLMQALQASM